MGKDQAAADGPGKHGHAGRERVSASESSRILFNDLCKFRNKRVLISVYGGEEVSGRLLGYDEVANCVLESSENRRIIVLGKSITSICDASTVVL